MRTTTATTYQKHALKKSIIYGLATIACIGTLGGGAYASQIQDSTAPSGAIPMAGKIQPVAKDPATVEPKLPALMATDDFAGISAGHGPVHLTVFVDPNCIYCHLFWERLQDPQFKDRFTVTYVPVAFVKKSSLGKAESLLALGHKPMITNALVRQDFSGGQSAMATDEANFDVVNEVGAIKTLNIPSMARIIETNTRDWGNLMKKLNQEAVTPTVIIGKDRLLVGAPPPDVLMAWAHGH